MSIFGSGSLFHAILPLSLFFYLNPFPSFHSLFQLIFARFSRSRLYLIPTHDSQSPRFCSNFCSPIISAPISFNLTCLLFVSSQFPELARLLIRFVAGRHANPSLYHLRRLHTNRIISVVLTLITRRLPLICLTNLRLDSPLEPSLLSHLSCANLFYA